MEVRASISHHRSAYQEIEIIDTVPFGRSLVLDGALQTTERDEFTYHESLVHIPLLSHPLPRRVLIIGGADGGCLRRVLQHPVERVVQVELDIQVIEACRAHLPGIAGGAYEDPRVELVIDDGFVFLQGCSDQFDAVLVDSTDPVAQAARLFSPDFYQTVAQRLAPGGLLATQAGSPLLMPRELLACYQAAGQIFPLTRMYHATVPSYPGGLWSFVIASAGPDPATVPGTALARRLRNLEAAPWHYTTQLHRASFQLPGYLALLLDSGDNRDLSRHPICIQ